MGSPCFYEMWRLLLKGPVFTNPAHMKRISVDKAPDFSKSLHKCQGDWQIREAFHILAIKLCTANLAHCEAEKIKRYMRDSFV